MVSETHLMTEIIDLQKRAEAYERIKETRVIAIETLKEIKKLVDKALSGLEPSIAIRQSSRNGKRMEMIKEVHQKMIEGASFSCEDIEKLYNVESRVAIYVYTKLKTFGDVKVREMRDGKKLKNLYV